MANEAAAKKKSGKSKKKDGKGDGDASEDVKSGGLKKMLIIGAAVVALGGGGATAFFMMKGDPESTLEANAATPDEDSDSGKAILTLNSFVVNLAGMDSNKFVKCSVRLLLPNDEAVSTTVENDIVMTRLRDRILTLLASKTYAEINTPVGKEALRREIMHRADETLGAVDVSDVFFIEFIIQ